MAPTKQRGKPGRKRSPDFAVRQQQVRALKPTHSYRQIAALLGITCTMAHYYGRVRPDEHRPQLCPRCQQPLPTQKKAA